MEGRRGRWKESKRPSKQTNLWKVRAWCNSSQKMTFDIRSCFFHRKMLHRHTRLDQNLIRSVCYSIKTWSEINRVATRNVCYSKRGRQSKSEHWQLTVRVIKTWFFAFVRLWKVEYRANMTYKLCARTPGTFSLDIQFQPNPGNGCNVTAQKRRIG